MGGGQWKLGSAGWVEQPRPDSNLLVATTLRLTAAGWWHYGWGSVEVGVGRGGWSSPDLMATCLLRSDSLNSTTCCLLFVQGSTSFDASLRL